MFAAIRFLLAFLFGLILTASVIGIYNIAQAKPQSEVRYNYVIISEVVSVYDGDTVRVNIPSWPPILGHNVPIRIRPADTPELRKGDCFEEKALGIAARDWVSDWLAGKEGLKLVDYGRGTFFRVVGDILHGEDLLSSAMIEAGHAVPYSEREHAWCTPEQELKYKNRKK
jgi:endonuclease YncB( thermonuclease family)